MGVYQNKYAKGNQGVSRIHEETIGLYDNPYVGEYLSTRFTLVTSGVIYCQYCEFPCKNKQSHSAHLRGCAKKKEMEKN